jgi:hypothetical protein
MLGPLPGPTYPEQQRSVPYIARQPALNASQSQITVSRDNLHTQSRDTL